MGIALDHDGGGDFDEAAGSFARLFFELINHYGARIRQLIASEAEKFLAHHFACQKALGFVGNFLLRVNPRLLRQVFSAEREQAFNVFLLLSAHREDLSKL